MTAVFPQDVLPLGAPVADPEPERFPRLLLAGEEDEETVDPHIVRGID